MLSVNNVSKSFKDRVVLDDVSFGLKDSEVMGLIGPNGAGKTTLLKIIAGQLKPDQGRVDVQGVVGYLPQEFNFQNLAVADYLAKHLDFDEPHHIDRVLDEVNLPLSLKPVQARDLSGGQKTRLSLAGVLLKNPDILLLDEPTNNLDIDGLQWLESFLKNYKGSVLLTSHDRAFLDAAATSILELKDGKVSAYGGNYSFYKEQKQVERRSELDAYLQNTQERKRLKRIRQQKGSLMKKVSDEKFDKIKHESRMAFGTRKNSIQTSFGKQIKAMHSRIWQMEEIDKPKDRISYPIELLGHTHATKLILEVAKVSKSFEAPVLKDVSFEIRGPKHVWLKGPNGIGKSTLLKIVAGQLAADDGEVKIGEGIKAGYFSQEISGLDVHQTGLEVLASSNQPQTTCFKVASMLHLGAEDVRKKVAELSRGQRAKLEFAKLLLDRNDLLILDEPTNHLETETREDIEQALGEYDGAILVASHDRYFLNAIGIDQETGL